MLRLGLNLTLRLYPSLKLIKGVAGFDPTGHAAVAWSVLFGLTISQFDWYVYDYMADDL